MVEWNEGNYCASGNRALFSLFQIVCLQVLFFFTILNQINALESVIASFLSTYLMYFGSAAFGKIVKCEHVWFFFFTAVKINSLISGLKYVCY